MYNCLERIQNSENSEECLGWLACESGLTGKLQHATGCHHEHHVGL